MKFLLPQGIGDSVWALHKIQSVSNHLGNGDGIFVYLNCVDLNSPIQRRALDFVKRFKFVNDADMLVTHIHDYSNYHDEEGHYIYIPDGWRTIHNGENVFALMPNGPLERGVRLEDWLPEYSVNWDAAKEFSFTNEELDWADALYHRIGPYCTFYLGPMDGNLVSGHNRGMIWTPQDWLALGQFCQNKLGLRVVVLGADYDTSYYDSMVLPIFGRYLQPSWINLIGETEIGATFAIVKRSRFTISYQSGIGIFSSYLGVPTGIFWREKGNSINSAVYLSFEEEMASAWTRPDMLSSGKHLPLIYGRHNVEYICNEIVKRGW